MANNGTYDINTVGGAKARFARNLDEAVRSSSAINTLSSVHGFVKSDVVPSILARKCPESLPGPVMEADLVRAFRAALDLGGSENPRLYRPNFTPLHEVSGQITERVLESIAALALAKTIFEGDLRDQCTEPSSNGGVKITAGVEWLFKTLFNCGIGVTIKLKRLSMFQLAEVMIYQETYKYLLQRAGAVWKRSYAKTNPPLSLHSWGIQDKVVRIRVASNDALFDFCESSPHLEAQMLRMFGGQKVEEVTDKAGKTMDQATETLATLSEVAREISAQVQMAKPQVEEAVGYMASIKKFLDALTTLAPMALGVAVVIVAMVHFYWPTVVTRVLLGVAATISTGMMGLSLWRSFPVLKEILTGALSGKVEKEDDADSAVSSNMDVDLDTAMKTPMPGLEGLIRDGAKKASPQAGVSHIEFAAAVVAVIGVFGITVDSGEILKKLGSLSAVKRGVDVIAKVVIDIIVYVAPSVKKYTGIDLISKLYPDEGYDDFSRDAGDLLQTASQGILPILNDEYDRLLRVILAGNDLVVALRKSGKDALNVQVNVLMRALAQLKEKCDLRRKHNEKLPAEPILIIALGTGSGTGKSTTWNAVEQALKHKCCENDDRMKESWEKDKRPYVHTRNGDKWNDGIHPSTEIIRFNDCFTKATVAGMDGSEAEEIIKMINVEEIALMFSGVDMKGSAGIRPKFVMVTTNTVSFNDQKSITNPQALVRRIEDACAQGTAIYFEKMGPSKSESSFELGRLKMFRAQRKVGDYAFEKSQTSITFQEIVQNACIARDKSVEKARKQRGDMQLAAEEAIKAYLRTKDRDLPSDQDIMDSLGDIQLETVEEDEIVPLEEVAKPEDLPMRSSESFQSAFKTTLDIDDDRKGWTEEAIIAFDRVEDMQSTISYIDLREGQFGEIDASSACVEGYMNGKPVLFQMRGYMLRYKAGTVAVSTMATITPKDLDKLPPLEKVAFKNSNFYYGGRWYSKEGKYENQFFIRAMFIDNPTFWGYMIKSQGMTTFFDITCRLRMTERIGVHKWYPTRKVFDLFKSWGWNIDYVPIPFWSWKLTVASMARKSGSGVCVGMDTFTIFAWILDTVLECAIDPLFVIDYARKNLVDLASMSITSVITYAKSFDVKKLISFEKIGSDVMTAWEKVKEYGIYFKNKLWEGAQKLWQLVKDNAMIIGVGVTVIAGAIAAFYGLQPNAEVVVTQVNALQSGAGTKTFVRTSVKPGKVVSRAQRLTPVKLQLGYERVTQITTLVQKNQYFLYVKEVTEDGFTKLGTVTFVQGRAAITNKHILMAVMARKKSLEKAGVSIKDMVKIENPEGSFSFSPDDLVFTAFGTSDVGRIDFPGFREHTDLTKHFMIEAKHNTYSASGPKSRLVNAINHEDATTTLDGTDMEVPLSDGTRAVIHHWYGYDVKTKDGDCGSVLVSNDGTTGGSILGIHVAGDGIHCGYAIKIPREDIIFILTGKSTDLSVEEETVIMDEQKVAAHYFLPYDHEVHNGVILTWNAELPSNVHSTTTKTQYGGTGPLPKEYTTALSNCGPKYYGNARLPYGPTVATVDGDVMETIGRHIGSRYRQMAKLGNKMIPIHQAIAGMQGTALKPIDASTSAGYPHAARGIQKREMFTFNDQGKLVTHGKFWDTLMPRIRILYKALTMGAGLNLLFTDNLKDERRKKEKVAAGKARLVSASPIELTVLTRMFFGSFMECVQAHPIESGTVIGLNPYSEDWDLLAKKMKVKTGNENRCGAGDYQGWDTNLNPKIGMSLRGCIREFYAGAPEWENIARERLLDMFFCSTHIRGGVIEIWGVKDADGNLVGFSWPSGNPLTAPGNSVMNISSFCYHYITEGDQMVIAKIPEFFNAVELVVIGDDNMYAVVEGLEEKFVESEVAHSMSKMGMVLTSDVKGEVNTELRHLEEVSIIKRKFRFEETVGRWVAPLDLDVVIEQCMWTQRTSYSATAAQNLAVTLAEISLHGKSVFEEWVPKLEAYYGKKNFRPPSKVWEIVLRDTLNKSVFTL